MTLALLVRTAGTNCDRETARALELAGARVETLSVRRLAAQPSELDRASLLVFPGGFSYGDDVAAGRLLGFELRQSLRAPLAGFVERGGHMLGVCNGFQALVDSGLFEPKDESRSVALAPNASGRFECRWSIIEPKACQARWIERLGPLPMPSAHGEGRFWVKDQAALERLEARGQIALCYAGDLAGQSAANHPNGSLARIAGICDPSGRVLGLMPHPERNITPWHRPDWTRRAPRQEGEGLSFYRELVRAAQASRPT